MKAENKVAELLAKISVKIGCFLKMFLEPKKSPVISGFPGSYLRINRYITSNPRLESAAFFKTTKPKKSNEGKSQSKN